MLPTRPLYYLYIIFDEDSGQFSIGTTTDLNQHLKSTPGHPRQIRVYSEAFETISEAEQRASTIGSWDAETMLKALER
jgi:predicted GIY-YIG superfamily endonuclease